MLFLECGCTIVVIPPRANEGEGFFMLYNVVVNDWGETTYVPTTLGNVLLAVVIIALLGVAMYFTGKGNKR